MWVRPRSMCVDPFVRIFHWTLVAGFTIAYLTEDDLLSVHVWAGYVVGALIVVRVLWGFVGPDHARFSDFLYNPATTLRYVRDLVLLRGRRYLGHSPGGGYMVVALLVLITATVVTGLIVYGGDQQAGPLAGMVTKATGEEMEEVHEVIANIALAFVFLHIPAVVFASFAHRENLGAVHGDGIQASLNACEETASRSDAPYAIRKDEGADTHLRRTGGRAHRQCVARWRQLGLGSVGWPEDAAARFSRRPRSPDLQRQHGRSRR